MASNALRLFQRALETTGHNIANVNTPGYSRQTVEFKTQYPLTYYSEGWKALGTGVGLSQIARVRDSYLEASSRNSAGNMGRFETLSASLGQIEGIYGEPSEEGISAALDKFFDAWSALGSNPSDLAARVQVQSAGSMLASRVRNAYGQLLSLGSQLQSSATTTIERVNELGNQIAGLNKEIRQFEATGGMPNDLLDKRDAAVRELSGLIDTKVERFQDGSYAVYVSGHALVDTGGSRPISAGTFDPVASTFTASGLTYTVKGGTLAGITQSVAQVENQKTQLNTFADELREQINVPHRTGIDQDGNTGNDFFNEAIPRTGAIDFSLSAAVAASPRAIAAGVTGAPGDGGLALTFSQMRDIKFVALGDLSFQDYFSTNVGQVGTQAAYYKAQLDTETAVAEQIANQVQAASGVSLDDEMAEMMRYQRSYQASARALTVLDQVTEDLIGMLRR
jgi:flagellar hook-associated protein 1 FlgK